MTFQGDPHRTLGVAPGASLNEIKSAYRRLAKQYHPDAAGDRALPRFLAIQSAYERLVDSEGRLRPAGSPSRDAAPRPQEPWRADPSRARASRDAWRARRGSRAGGGAAGFDWAKPGAGASERAEPSGGPGEPEEAPPKRDRPHREHHARRGPRKATPGSTTYDEASELPLDPAWEGGAWYGPSSGTFWTINPREYADPRKHGPEYLARARRASQEQDPERFAGEADDAPTGPGPGVDGEVPVGGEPSPSPETDASGTSPRWGWSGRTSTTTDGGAEWGTRAWRYDEVPASRVPGDRRRRRATPAGPDAAEDPLPDLESLVRRFAPGALLALARRPDRRWRLLLALTGWPPVGFAVGSLVAEATGCAGAAGSCAEPAAALPLLLQPVVVAVLFLVPPAAAVAAFAGIVALAVALPVAALLAAGGTSDAGGGAPVLGVVGAVTYFLALAIGARAAWRAPDRQGERGAGP